MNPTGALLIAALAIQAGSGGATSANALSRDASNSFGKKLETLEKYEHDPKGKHAPITISEGELNSYVRFALAEKIPRGLRDIRIILRDGRLELRGVANLAEFGELKDKAGSSASLLSFLSGEMSVEIVADFKSDKGFGQFEVVSAQIGPVPLSASILGDIVARATVDSARPNGFDIRAPFRLPYSARRIRAQPASAIVEY